MHAARGLTGRAGVRSLPLDRSVSRAYLIHAAGQTARAFIKRLNVETKFERQRKSRWHDVFVGPVAANRRLLARIEAGIMDSLYAAPAPFLAVPDKGMFLSRRWRSEFPVHNLNIELLHVLPVRLRSREPSMPNKSMQPALVPRAADGCRYAFRGGQHGVKYRASRILPMRCGSRRS